MTASHNLTKIKAMKKCLLLLFACCLFFPAAYAQKHLEGLWEGVIAKGGIYSNSGYKFELLIELDGSKVTGRSYIYVDDDQIIEMDIKGLLYADRSIYLEDMGFIASGENEFVPPFNRKYQLIYSRSIWDNKLEGYWQQIITSPFDRMRKRGRVYLKKVEKKKA